MIRLSAALLMMGVVAAGCGPSASDNPPQLFLALDGDELHAKLVPAAPPHY